MSVLKIVPNKSSSGQDNRRQFFIDNANSNKYYYMPIGDVQHNPNRNTLVPLGTFLGFIDYRPAPGGYGMMKIDDGNVGTEYYMRFSNYPYNATDREVGAVGMDINPLVYTDEPPAAGSVPLHYYDYVQMIYPKAFDENGRPIYNERFPIQHLVPQTLLRRVEEERKHKTVKIENQRRHKNIKNQRKQNKIA